MPFQDYRQFIDLCDQSTLEDRAKISEFYLHNLAFIIKCVGPKSKARGIAIDGLSIMNES